MFRIKIASLMGVALLANMVYGAEIKRDKYPVASDLNVKLRAYAAFEAGGSRQSRLNSSEKNLSAHRRGFLFYNDTALFATISNKHEEIEYGGKIILVPTAQRKNIPRYNGSHIFIKSGFGHIELGSPIPAAKKMMISDGGIPGKYIKKNTAYLKQDRGHAPSFLTGDGSFLGDSIVADFDKAKYSKEPPRTINYHTPKFALSDTTKMQVGVSYTPDSSNTGAGSANENTTSASTKKIKLDSLYKFEMDKAVTGAITAGVNLEQKINDAVSFKIALTGEYGKTKGKAKKYLTENDKDPTEHKLANLRSYNIGGELKVNDFIFNSCYGNLGKSFTTPEFHKSGRKSHYYNAGISYKYEKTTTKIAYFGSEQYKNKVSALKLNISTSLAPGLKPYVELSSYRLKGKPEFYQELARRSTRGTVALCGLKLVL